MLAYWTANGHRYSPPLPDSLLNEESLTEGVLKNYRRFLEDSGWCPADS